MRRGVDRGRQFNEGLRFGMVEVSRLGGETDHPIHEHRVGPHQLHNPLQKGFSETIGIRQGNPHVLSHHIVLSSFSLRQQQESLGVRMRKLNGPAQQERQLLLMRNIPIDVDLQQRIFGRDSRRCCWCCMGWRQGSASLLVVIVIVGLVVGTGRIRTEGIFVVNLLVFACCRKWVGRRSSIGCCRIRRYEFDSKAWGVGFQQDNVGHVNVQRLEIGHRWQTIQGNAGGCRGGIVRIATTLCW